MHVLLFPNGRGTLSDVDCLLLRYLLLCYAPISVRLLRTFRCVDIDGTPYLLADVRVECYTRTWLMFAGWSGALLVLYTVGLPLTILLVLRRHRHQLRERATRARFGFLYKAVGPHAYAC